MEELSQNIIIEIESNQISLEEWFNKIPTDKIYRYVPQFYSQEPIDYTSLLKRYIEEFKKGGKSLMSILAVAYAKAEAEAHSLKNKLLNKEIEVYFKVSDLYWNNIIPTIQYILCDNSSPKEWVQSLIKGDTRAFIIALISAFKMEYSVDLAIAAPIVGMIMNKGILNFCSLTPQ